MVLEIIDNTNSAAGAMASARDIKKYGILGIRGKIINCLAHTEEKIFENEEIKLLLSAMNIVPGKYDSKKLRYGKIAICTDADRTYRTVRKCFTFNQEGLHINVRIDYM